MTKTDARTTKRNYFKSLREARAVCKARNEDQSRYTALYPCEVRKVGNRYFVGGHWQWLQAVS